MIISKLSLNGIDYILNAIINYGEEFDGSLNGMTVLGVYNDGKNYNYTDKNGNTYVKQGNVVSIHSKKYNDGLSRTISEGTCARLVYSKTGEEESLGIYINNMPSYRSQLSGKVQSASIYNDSAAVSNFISEKYTNSTGFTCLGISSNNYFGVWVAKHYNETWSADTVSMNGAYSGGSSSLVRFDLTGVYSEGEPKPSDPYVPGGVSGEGGGTGNFDGTGDDVDIPALPTLSAVDTGFITLFNPSADELRNLSNYMWGDLFDLNTWKKIFANPMDAILGLSIVPVAVPNGGQAEVTVGNISTGISMNKASAQYVSVDCGTLNVNEYWGSYLDYDPYTKAEIYLPYIGIRPLSVGDIMNKAVHVVYHIDILSGACCAYVKCGGSVLYSFVGQCSCSIPITGNDWTNVVNGALSIAASIGTMVATGGATAPMAATTIASTAVNSMKPNIEKSGSMGGMGGMLGVQTPYLILTRPRQALPARQNSFMGYPSFITLSLGECSGYTEIESVHLENIPATKQELLEIESLLKGGVIL